MMGYQKSEVSSKDRDGWMRCGGGAILALSRVLELVSRWSLVAAGFQP